MKILGIDGLDYWMAKVDMPELSLLEQDMKPILSPRIWISYFSGIKDIDLGSWGKAWKFKDLDYIWNHGDWTVIRAPIMNPLFSKNFIDTPLQNIRREEVVDFELFEIGRAYKELKTEHLLAVVRNLDDLSHRWAMEKLIPQYKLIADWLKDFDFDIIISDHGFARFGGSSGPKDHSPYAVIKGVNVQKATEFVDYIGKLKETLG